MSDISDDEDFPNYGVANRQASRVETQRVRSFVRSMQDLADANTSGSQIVDAVANHMMRVAEEFGEAEHQHPMMIPGRRVDARQM